MTLEQIRNIAEIDDVADKNGGYLDFVTAQKEHYDYRKIIEYCKSNNLSPLELTEKEKSFFVIK